MPTLYYQKILLLQPAGKYVIGGEQHVYNLFKTTLKATGFHVTTFSLVLFPSSSVPMFSFFFFFVLYHIVLHSHCEENAWESVGIMIEGMILQMSYFELSD